MASDRCLNKPDWQQQAQPRLAKSMLLAMFFIAAVLALIKLPGIPVFQQAAIELRLLVDEAVEAEEVSPPEELVQPEEIATPEEIVPPEEILAVAALPRGKTPSGSYQFRAVRGTDKETDLGERRDRLYRPQSIGQRRLLSCS